MRGGRLVIPTATPFPTPTPWPTLDSGWRVSPTPEFRVPVVEDPRSCTGEFREMLVNYRGRIPFSAQVAFLLARDLRSERPDCVDLGWNPEFDPGLSCEGASVGGVMLSPDLIYRAHALASRDPQPTGKDERGNVLVHFARVPLQDAPGCWYYSVKGQVWGWWVSGGGSGEGPAGVPRL